MENTIYLVVEEVVEFDYNDDPIMEGQVIECFLDEELAKKFADTHEDYRVKEMALGDYKYAHVKEKNTETVLSVSIQASLRANTKEFSEYVFTTGRPTRGQNPKSEIHINTFEVSFTPTQFEVYVYVMPSPNREFFTYGLHVHMPISLDDDMQQNLKERWEQEGLDILFTAIDIYEKHEMHAKEEVPNLVKEELVKRNLFFEVPNLAE